ncbi:transglycosylase SLT domain-containing protein [Streptomyces gibsoniae]|uniref:Transglycosylase SLT domain-containing protein n=1 Tax=Streptomyces gibsoniae TaxID=3075529 RepID=A0ABU2U9W7_9ACTN|nr:transglycosylase SLT domain-containing protein [Streptomyces sp. DSM 41699]MDT0470012.1 transglycosylase SLT domain-containing protein [Streptomyces sp. DSM 41699]
MKPVFGWISDKAKWLYDKGLKPAFDNVKSAVGLVGDAFGDAKDAIKKAWDKVVDITKKPVNFVIDAVYTHGIKAVWDKVADFVGLDPLPKAPKLLAAGGTVGDGWGVARPMKTNRPTAIVGEGNPRYPEFVIPTDPKYRGRAKSLWHAAGTQLLESGGILGDAWDWTKSAFVKGIDWAKTGADLIAHPSKVWNTLVKPILNSVRDGVGTFPMGDVLTAFPSKIVKSLKDKIVEAVAGGGGGGNIGGSIPTGQRRSIITQALAAARIPPPGSIAQWLAGFNTLITRESGWNPNAINLWDSNAKAGHPSQGLTQTIPSTFNAYVPASLRSRGILDPVANVAASARYIKAVYGNITNVQQANANKPPMGYDLDFRGFRWVARVGVTAGVRLLGAWRWP